MIEEKLSVVIPVGPRHDGFGDLMEEYDAAIRDCASDVEYVVVIDGDHPDAVAALERFQDGERDVRIVQLTRPFGDSIAISAGIEHSGGQLIMTLPSFFQIDPASIPELFARLDDHDMIEGRRWPRQDSALNRFSTWLYHRIIRLVTGHNFRDIGCSARIMRRRVAEEVMLYGEQNAFLPLLASSRGFSVCEVSVPQSIRDPYLRYYGPGIYARRLIDIFTIFFLIRFTKAPLRFFGVIGSISLIVGLVLISIVVGERLFADLPAAGRPMLLFGVVFLVLGVQLFAIGLIGELIIFTHGRGLKEYTVAEIVNSGDSDEADRAPE